MVNRFLRFIAFAFILQMTWGVASAYCLHETDKASQHFGHHQHEHRGGDASGDDSTSPPAKKTTNHIDCASCAHTPVHGSTSVDGLLEPLPTAHQLHSPLPDQPNPYLGAPERPQWYRAA